MLGASTARPAPVTESERIESIDVLRGFAVLGILIMNIQSFAMVGATYLNPTALGPPSTIDYAIWLVSHVVADRKFMTIFSMLFGAGVILMASRAEARGARPGPVHFRRMLILLVLGIMHAYLLWYGDILFHYAVCGALIYPCRRWRPATLIVVGLMVTGVASGLSLLFGLSMPHWPPEQIRELTTSWAPSAEAAAKEVAAYQGGWWAQMADRVPTAVFFETFLFAVEFLWRAGGLMLVGMGLYKLRVFSAERSSRFYLTWVAIAAFIAIPVILYGVYRNEVADWSIKYSFFLGGQYNFWASILVSMAWIGLVMLVYKHHVARWATRLLAAAGRMALTCYLLETVLCTFVFYGHGLALFGKVGRVGQIAVLLGVWAVLLAFSAVWLRRFRFGPAEWLWRMLTYLHTPPMRRGSPLG